jgi:hypothetical protein
MVKSSYERFVDFLNDYEGIINQVAADPSVMYVAAEIKDLRYQKSGGIREVGTLDAIHLASALALINTFGVPLAAFHIFDDGKGKSTNGKAVPLLSYEEWCESCSADPSARQVIALRRTKPDHPNPRLFK